MSNRLSIFLASLALTLCAVTPLAAQEALSGAVVSVKGPLVAMRTGEGQPWQLAKAGMPVNQGTEFRTGPRSSVVFRIEPDQIITLDRTGTMSIIQAVRQADGKIKTDLAMKFGRNNYKIEQAGLEHESTIHTPASTLSVRGSEMTSWHGFNTGSKSSHHSATFTPTKKNAIKLPQDMEVNTKSPDAGSVAKEKQTVDPMSSERTRPERRLIVNRPNGNFPGRRNDPRNRHHVDSDQLFTHP